MSVPNILAFAYACEPGKGSEPGAGWAMARVAARIGPTWVITRANNREAVEAALPTVPERDRLNFVYVDLPPRLIRWKRGKRGIHVYYVLWQFAALRSARSLLRQQRFDLAWHVTMANIWLGSAAPLTDLPFVYGPVGGGVGTSWRLLPSVGVAGSAFEVSRSVVRAAARHLNPLSRLAMRRARVIFVQNEETLKWVPASLRSKAVVEPNAIVDAQPERTGRGDRPPTALFAGELIPLKGVALAIRAVALAPEWRLLICGKGADERRLRAMADRLGVKGRVRFLGQIPRDEVLRLMAEEADLLLFPSLHDEGPMVVAEALTVGLPVVCLDRGGARGFGGIGVAAGSVRQTSARLALALRTLPVQAPSSRFSLDAASQRFADLLRSRGLLDD